MFADGLEQVRAHGEDAVIDIRVEELSALADLIDAEQSSEGTPGFVAEQVLDNLQAAEPTPLVDTLLVIKFFGSSAVPVGGLRAR
jgi:hypothetical protein